jgi:hypothetical protein
MLNCQAIITFFWLSFRGDRYTVPQFLNAYDFYLIQIDYHTIEHMLQMHFLFIRTKLHTPV